MAEPQTGSSLRFEHPKPESDDVKPITDAELARIVNRSGSGATVTDDTPEAKQRNRARAQEELGLISELRNTKSFQWFFDVCLRRNFKEYRGLMDSTVEDDSSKVIAVRVSAFQQWRKAVRWLTEREIEARRLLDPKDPRLIALREELDGY